MSYLKGLALLVLVSFIVIISNELTNLRFASMQKAGILPYGPVPSFENKSYDFTSVTSSTLFKYPAEKIGEMSKSEFELVILNTLTDKDKTNLKPHLSTILNTSETYQLDPFWVLSVVMVESRFDSKAISAKKAQGLMQIQPETATHLYQLMKRKVDENLIAKLLMDKNENLDIGVFYLKKLLQNFRMNYHMANIAYNLGPNKLKFLVENDEITLRNNEYDKNVTLNYKKFVDNFNFYVSKIPNAFENTYVVKGQGLKLEEVLLKNMGLFKFAPTGSENLAY